jgi:transcriptional regulator with XRE-family HTH domain
MTAAELVGRNIRRLRKARGLKQTTLAEMCGYSAKASGTISKIERGQIAIDVNVAGRIARALGVELPELFQGEAPATTGASGQEVVPPDAQRLLALWPQLAPNDRETLQRGADVLAAGEADLRQKLSGLVKLMTDTLRTRRRRRGDTGAAAVGGTPAG